MNKHKHPLVRWLWVLVYAVVGLCLGLPLGEQYAVLLSKALPGGPLLFQWALFFVITGTLIFVLTRLLRPRFEQFASLWLYPPTFISVPLAGVLLLLVQVSGFDFFPLVTVGEASWLPALIAAYFAGLIVCCSFSVITRLKSATTPRSNQKPLTLEELATVSWDEFVAWFDAETPIDHPTQATFDQNACAERVWQCLQQSRDMQSGRGYSPTVVIYGPHGIGKTSITKLVQKLAKSAAKPRYLFVEINCWGFESSLKAREFVVEKCVERLGEVADVTALRPLPRAYIRALSQSDGWLKSLTSFVETTPAPQARLAKLTLILQALDMRLVAVIEDTNRNSEDFDQSQIEAMLHDFRQTDRLSFILTTGPGNKIDYAKIATRMEYPPALPPEIVLRALDRMRDWMRNEMRRKSCIDLPPLSNPSARLDSLHAALTENELKTHLWPADLARLIVTPRSLKHILRGLHSSWTHLSGEVDLDDLIMVTALRHAAPEAYAFLGEHFVDIDRLDWTQHPSVRQGDKKVESDPFQERLMVAWQEAAGRGGFPRVAAEAVLSEVRQKLRILFQSARYTQSPGAQSVDNKLGQKYWQRISTETIDPYTVRDQTVLAAIQAALTNDCGVPPLASQCVASAEFSRLFVYFEDFFRSFSERLRFSLMSAANDEVVRLHGAKSPADCPGHQMLRGWFMRRLEPKDDPLRQWLFQELTKFIPGHVRMMNDVYYYHTNHTPIKTEARALIRDLLKKKLQHASGVDFSAGLDPGYPYSLYHLVFTTEDGREGELLARAQDWVWLAPLVLDGIKQRPATMLPQAIYAFGNTMPGRGDPPTGFAFREDRVHEFFGKSTSESFRLVAKTEADYPELSPHQRQVVAFAQSAAQEWLQKDFESSRPAVSKG